MGIISPQIMSFVRPCCNDNPPIAEHVFNGPKLVDKVAVSVTLARRVNGVSPRPRKCGYLLLPVNNRIAYFHSETRLRPHFWNELVSQEEGEEDDRSDQCK